MSLILVIGVYISPVACSNCSFSRLSVDPVDPTTKEHFIGKGRNIEVLFRNESKNQVVDVFPEPPMTIRNRVSGLSCEIDGGIWVRRSVYLSNDEKTLIVQEYSGCNGFLVFYDTGTCKKVDELDVSHGHWKISENLISIGYQCSNDDINSCRSVKKHVLDKFCRLQGKDKDNEE